MAAAAESAVLFSNAQLVDGTTQDAREGYNVLVEGGRIREVSDRPITAKSAHTIDLGGKVLMPGLIDCHVHVVAGLASLGGSAALPNSLVAARAAVAMKSMLMRGFTTVRDVGGADHGLVMAVDEGSIIGPRLVICGKALSQTGGHADFRGRFDDRPPTHYPSRLGAVGRVVDGVPDIRRAAREEIKSGARFIKIMANGGVASRRIRSSSSASPGRKWRLLSRRRAWLRPTLPVTSTQTRPFAGSSNAAAILWSTATSRLPKRPG